MESVRVLPRQPRFGDGIVDPEQEDDGILVNYDPSDPASIDRAQRVLAGMFGWDLGPVLFGGTLHVSIWKRMACFLLSLAKTPSTVRNMFMRGDA